MKGHRGARRAARAVLGRGAHGLGQSVGVVPAQMRAWLKRACGEGHVRKLRRPARYAAAGSRLGCAKATPFLSSGRWRARSTCAAVRPISGAGPHGSGRHRGLPVRGRSKSPGQKRSQGSGALPANGEAGRRRTIFVNPPEDPSRTTTYPTTPTRNFFNASFRPIQDLPGRHSYGTTTTFPNCSLFSRRSCAARISDSG